MKDLSNQCELKLQVAWSIYDSAVQIRVTHMIVSAGCVKVKFVHEFCVVIRQWICFRIHFLSTYLVPLTHFHWRTMPVMDKFSYFEFDHNVLLSVPWYTGKIVKCTQ